MAQPTAPQQPARAWLARERGVFDVQNRRCHLVGIGGCGMSALARMLRARGAEVSGSDMQSSDVTDALRREGVRVDPDRPADHPRAGLPDPLDLVICSAAIPPEHPQRLAAERAGLPVMTYAEALGACMLGRTGVALAGTHGKSTTAAMLGVALAHAGIDPTVVIGAACAQLGRDDQPTGFRLGAERIPAGPLTGRPGALIAEACEFNRSFHNLHPTIASISAVEADHLDVYGSLDAVVESFRDFARLLPPASEGGRLLIAHDGAHRREVTAGVDAAIETIGASPEADWNVRYEPDSSKVALAHRDEVLCEWQAGLPGAHMASNSATAAALAITLGADPTLVAEALADFQGVDRRMEFLGERHGVRVWDDYGHHPTEIDATLRALRQFERPEERGGRLICVFQPHQHSRTRFLLEEFAQAFTQADVVIVPHIYFVRDSEIEKSKVRAADLVDRLRTCGVAAMHLYPFEAIVEQLEHICRPNDLLVVMGAGPVWRVARGYLDAAPRREAV